MNYSWTFVYHLSGCREPITVQAAGEASAYKKARKAGVDFSICESCNEHRWHLHSTSFPGHDRNFTEE